jgi:hypothetical protein
VPVSVAQYLDYIVKFSVDQWESKNNIHLDIAERLILVYLSHTFFACLGTLDTGFASVHYKTRFLLIRGTHTTEIAPNMVSAFKSNHFIKVLEALVLHKAIVCSLE